MRLRKQKMSRLRLFETGNLERCWDRNSSRPGNLKVVKTETVRDWGKVVETETLLRVSLITEPCKHILYLPCAFYHTKCIFRRWKNGMKPGRNFLECFEANNTRDVAFCNSFRKFFKICLSNSISYFRTWFLFIDIFFDQSFPIRRY